MDRQRRLRPDAEPVGTRVVAGWLVGWIRCGARRRSRAACDGDRRRRLDPDPRRVLWPGGPEADRRVDRAPADPVVARGLHAGAARAGHRRREAAAARDARAGARRSVGRAVVAVRRREAQARARDTALARRRPAATRGRRTVPRGPRGDRARSGSAGRGDPHVVAVPDVRRHLGPDAGRLVRDRHGRGAGLPRPGVGRGPPGRLQRRSSDPRWRARSGSPCPTT